MEITIKEFSQDTISKEEWSDYHSFRRNYHEQNTPDKYFFENELAESTLIHSYNSTQRIYRFFFVYHDGKLIGNFSFGMFKEDSASYKGNEHNMNFRIQLIKDYRRKGIGRIILSKILSFAESYNKTMLISNFVIEQDGKSFLWSIKPDFTLKGVENKILFNDVDWDMLHQWIDEGKRLNPQITLVIVDKIPEKYLNGFCNLYSKGFNEAPHAEASGAFVITPEVYRKREEENNQMSMVTETALTIDPDNTVIGMSEFYSNAFVKNYLAQNLTTVLPDARGRKLGKWLKASLYLHAKEKYKNHIGLITANAAINAPMLAINKKIGFKQSNEWVHWQISSSELKKYIEQNAKIIENEMSLIKNN